MAKQQLPPLAEIKSAQCSKVITRIRPSEAIEGVEVLDEHLLGFRPIWDCAMPGHHVLFKYTYYSR